MTIELRSPYRTFTFCWLSPPPDLRYVRTYLRTATTVRLSHKEEASQLWASFDGQALWEDAFVTYLSAWTPF